MRAKISLFAFLMLGSITGFNQPQPYKRGSVELYYEVKGTGPALYILSGGPGEAPEHPYRQLMDSLKSLYTCVLVHQRGSGLSRNLPINSQTDFY